MSDKARLAAHLDSAVSAVEAADKDGKEPVLTKEQTDALKEAAKKTEKKKKLPAKKTVRLTVKKKKKKKPQAQQPEGNNKVLKGIVAGICVAAACYGGWLLYKYNTCSK